MVSEVNGPGIGSVGGIDNGRSKVDKAGAATATTAPTAIGEGADIVTLTDLTSRLQTLVQSVADIPVADQQKIAAFQQSLADGTYHVDSQAVAEKLAAIESLLSELPPPS